MQQAAPSLAILAGPIGQEEQDLKAALKGYLFLADEVYPTGAVGCLLLGPEKESPHS